MSTAHPSRQLLFGILAFQMDFISRRQLIDATQAWLQGKSRTMEEILVEQGALSERNRDLLVPLVDRHIENHEEDPNRSLASLSSIGSVRDDLERLGDSQLDATMSIVASEPGTERTAPTVVQDVTIGASSIAGQLGSGDFRFRILRPYARGGLGEVSLAQDTELNREVALKEIQAQFADDEGSRARFVLEAEVTGGLEHPGIVPVYGLGKYADGRPFYAMRFIKGDSLRQAADRIHKAGKSADGESPVDYESVEFRKLLGRFIDVCNAIEYAHSRGVLHRDLKPGNVMLGKYGETLVVDWGLAKIKDELEVEPRSAEPVLRPSSGSGSAPTEFGRAIGTPAYMSPEQAAGRLDELGAASDVYSLGATLFYVLAGKPPFTKQSLTQLLHAVTEGDFQAPRQVSPGVPQPLDAICLQAMSKDPAHRYPSPQALADDLERWLGDEPVHAYRDPLLVKARRWIRRHQTLTTGVASAILVAIVLLSVGLGLLAEVNRRLDDSNGQLNLANAELEKAIQRETAARKQAVASQQRADENFRLAREAVDNYFTDVSENTLLEVPGMQPLRQQLLDAALTYYQEFVTKEEDTPELQSDLASAHFRLGKLTSSINRAEEARTHFRKAQELFGQVVDSEENTMADRLDHASTFEHLALLADDVGEPETAEQGHRAAMRIRQEIYDEDPELSRAADALVHSYNNLASLTRQEGRYEEAREFLEKAIAVGNAMVESHPDDTDHLSNLAITYNEYGLLHSRQGKPEEAAPAYEKSVELWQDLSEASPETLRYQNYLAGAYVNLGGVQQKKGDTTASLNGYRKAIGVFEELSARNPTVTKYRENLAHAYLNLGNLLFSTFQREEALAALNSALEIREKLLDEQPENVDLQHGLAAAHHNLGNVLRDAQELDQAEQRYDAAIRIWEPLHESRPNVVAVQKGLGTAYIGIGYLVYLREDLEGCLPHLRKAVPMLEPHADAKVPLQVCHMIIADALDKLKKYPEAADAYEWAIELQKGPSRNALRVKRALALARAKRHEEATTEARELMLPDQVPFETIYDAACVFALSIPHAQADEELPEDERDQRIQKYREDALTLLNRAQNGGFFDDPKRIENADQDTDLDALRDLEMFKRWRAQLTDTPAAEAPQNDPPPKKETTQ